MSFESERQSDVTAVGDILFQATNRIVSFESERHKGSYSCCGLLVLVLNRVLYEWRIVTAERSHASRSSIAEPPVDNRKTQERYLPGRPIVRK
ncbi:hypothetical protein SBV1_1940002 [Verrucomicrobia bacterium]|nr:hypothetical protein SBV1_1940002 [Verrucomicrobiota bacterium]